MLRYIQYHLNTYVPDFSSEMTDGRIHNGGTGNFVSIKCSGFPTDGFITRNGISFGREVKT